ncbi:cyclin-dependent kinase inhibitor far1 [Yamadazyma tenuis]|nr:cyclin-dependent kinase inhibitor far1 [Yamadazyma tenuis]
MIPDPLYPPTHTLKQEVQQRDPQDSQEDVNGRLGYPKPSQSYLQQDRLSQQQSQLLSPRSSFNKNLNKDLFDSLMKPKVKFISEHEDCKVKVDSQVNDDYCLNYLISVKPPTFYNCINEDKNLVLKNQILEEIKFGILNNIINSNDENVIDFNSLGKLVIFEIIGISTNGTNWDQVRLLLFESCLILVDLKGEVLIGKISIDQDILNMTRFVSGIRLDLNNDTIPELQICCEIPLIISRLEYFFKKLLEKQFVSETSLFQLTTNGWGLIKENYSNLPVDIIRFQNCIENSLDIPESLLAKSMPSPELIPLNLILSITLLQSSSISNNEYRTKIISFLDRVRKDLRPIDRLSLIFVGIDGSGFPCKKGSFIGSVEPNWSGWDSIYNEVKVQSNLNSQHKPILTSHWDEMQLTLEKCKDLFPFLNCNSNNTTKLVVISCNDYEPTLVNNEKLNTVKTHFKTLLNDSDKNLSVDFFRVGDSYTPELEFGQKICSQPSLIFNDILKIPHSSSLRRFNNLDEFSDEFLSILKSSYHQICLPAISLDISKIIGTRDIVSFHKIEVNGKMLEIENFSNLKIFFNNITVNCEETIMLKLRLNMTKLKSENLDYNDKVVDLPLLSYMPSWLHESDDYKVLHTQIYQNQQASTFNSFLDGSLTPPSTNECSAFFTSDFPVKSRKYVRKEIEIEIIKGLALISQNQMLHNQDILRHLIDFIYNRKRLFEETESSSLSESTKSSNSSLKQSKFSPHATELSSNNYIDSLLHKLGNLMEMFNVNDPSVLTACKDFKSLLT